MALTKEQLMAPRYKVILDFPGNSHEIGHILNYTKGDDWDQKQIAICEKYPHLFQKLQWHEHRAQKEMPEYVKVICYPSNGKIIKVHDWEFCVFWICEEVGIKHSYMQDEIEPATEDQYLAYIQKQTTTP